MNKVEANEKLYAVWDNLDTVTTGSTWYGSQGDYLQIQRMCYDAGKKFRAHKHKFRPRTAEFTQEAFVILKGSMKAVIYDEEYNLLDTITLCSDNVLICFRGAHEFEILENGTVAFEIKNGPYTTAEEDKEFK